MKNSNLLSIIILTLITSFASAQRVDIDKTRIKVQIANYPLYDIPLAERTYKVNYTGSEYFKNAVDNFTVKNFKEVDENPALSFNVHVVGFNKSRVSTSSRKEETKNKAGKVTSSRTYYKGSYSNYGTGSVKVAGKEYPMWKYLTPKQLEREAKTLAKKEAEEKEKAAKKKKEEDSNPFLDNVDTDMTAEDADEEVSEGEVANVFYNSSIGYNYNHTGKESTSSKVAYSSALSDRGQTFPIDRQSYFDYLPSIINGQLNKAFNYSKRTENASFRTLDSRKHPENQKFNQAMDALKVILGKMRYNKPNDQVTADLEPILSYLNSVAKKYPNSDKQGRKVRAAALFNIGKIYIYLEDAEKVTEYAKILIRDDYRDGDGKDFMEKADLIRKRNEFFNPDNRYGKIEEGEDDSETDDGTVVEDEDEEGGN